MAGLTEQDLREVERVASALVTLMGPRPPWQAVICGVEMLGLSTKYLITQDLNAAKWAVDVMRNGLSELEKALDEAKTKAEAVPEAELAEAGE